MARPKTKEPRCSYKEGARRCSFAGVGDPPLCRPHQLAVAEAARPKSPGEVVWTSLIDAINGEQVDPRAFANAFASVFDEFTRMRRPPGGWYPPPGDHRRAPTHDENLQQLRAAARGVMGFAPREPLTEKKIKDRKRMLAMQHHPDRGGTPQRMAAINDAADVLLEELGGR
jgi:hypothetical protein